MPQTSIFQWQEGFGWLVLSGGGDFLTGESEAVDTRMLSRSAADGGLAYIWAAGDLTAAEQYLQYLDDLGGPSSYLVDVVAEDDAALESLLGEAGIIVIGDGPQADRLYNGLSGVGIKALATAFRRGALVMGIGAGAEVFGQWRLRPASQGVQPGFDWLTSAAILTGNLDNAERRTLKGLLRAQPLTYGLGIGAGSALALGPEGQIESWGMSQIAVSLGQGYSAAV